MVEPSAPSPLHGLTESDRWDADDLFRRLSLVAHAAFLDSAFYPCSAATVRAPDLQPAPVPAATPTFLPCRFTLPELLRRGAEDVVTVSLSSDGDGDRRRFLLWADADMAGGQRSTSRERAFAEAWVAAVLGGSLDDACRALEVEAAGASLWTALAGEFCLHVFLDMCVTPGAPAFMPLPSDVRAAIMGVSDAADDVATTRPAAVAALPSPLYGVTDAGGWIAEDVFGRLGLVAHAVFLDAGFLPHRNRRRRGDRGHEQAAHLPRRYTLPHLVNQKDVDVVVARLWRDGDFFHCLAEIKSKTKGMADAGDGAGRSARRDATLPAARVAAVLCGSLDHAARRLRAWLWGALSDGVCRDVFVSMCGMNGVLVPEPGRLDSLPGDITGVILAKLDDGKDLARVECTCRQMRDAIADRDGLLWRARYEAIAGGEPSGSTSLSWKERYAIMQEAQLRARREEAELANRNRSNYRSYLGGVGDFGFPPFGLQAQGRQIPPWDFFSMVRRPAVNVPTVQGMLVVDRVQRTPAGRNDVVRRRKIVSNQAYRHGGAGAIHSSSSRYRWKHR